MVHSKEHPTDRWKRSLDHQDGARREAHDIFGHRPEQEASHTPPAVRPDDDQVGVDVGRELSDLLCGRLDAEMRDDSRKTAIGRLAELLPDVSRLRLDVALERARQRRSGSV